MEEVNEAAAEWNITASRMKMGEPHLVPRDQFLDPRLDSRWFFYSFQDQNTATGAPIPLSDYAVGLCKQPINGYSDWYLPAACEMGQIDVDSPCGSDPIEQNMAESLSALLSASCTDS